MCEDWLDTLCFETIDVTVWGFLIEFLVFVLCFIGLGIVCDDHLSVSLETLCTKLGLPDDVAGATFMALGSAAPELIISSVTVMTGTNNLGVGAIIGSGMIAFTMIPGACGIFAPASLDLDKWPVFRDTAMFMCALGLLYLGIQSSGGVIDTFWSLMLISFYLFYLVVLLWRQCIMGGSENATAGDAATPSETEALSPRNIGAPASPKQKMQRAFRTVKLLSKGIRGFRNHNRSVLRLVRHESMIREKALAEGLEDDVPGELSFLERVWWCISTPWDYLFGLTCPDCEIGSKHENLWPVTVMTSFAWLTVFSFVISAIVNRWVKLSGMKASLFGMIVISLGAQLPDTMQSVSAARRGMGGMAVGNAVGSQTINITIALGLPWLISNLAGKPVDIGQSKSLPVAVFFLSACALLYFCILMPGFLCKGIDYQVTLGAGKGYLLLAAYVGAVASYVVYELH